MMTPNLLLYAWLQTTMAVYTLCQSFPIVNSPSGPIKGVVVPTHGQDIVQFRNIPYAKPPVGDLRFARPLPVDPWTEILDGTRFGPSCMQDKNIFPDLWKNVENDAISEDCLQLNIYVPGTASTEMKMPVMVWIHGGGFFMGNGSSYDASLFTTKDVIVVTINYRIGIFGFMSTEDSALHGNYGLWDMIEALRWINKNIASFGGNPKSVTIFGESAGGFAVSHLAMIPRTKGLFQRIIPQSGPAVAFMGVAPNPARVAKAVGKFVGCVVSKDEVHIDNKDLVNCLKQKSADELLQAQSDPGTQFFGSFSLSPVIWPTIDGELLSMSPLDSLNDPTSEESTYFRSLDMLTGTTDNEASVVAMSFAGLQEPMGFNMAEGIPTSVLCNVFAPTLAKEMFNDETVASDLLCKEYSASDLEQQARNISILYGDAMFVSPTVQLLDFHSKGKTTPNTFQYTFTQAVNFPLLVPLFPWMEGAGHGTEIVYMFGPTGYNQMDGSLSTDEGRAFTDTLVTYWTNFAKTGNPNGEGLVSWKAYSSTDRDYMELKYRPEPGQNLYKRRMEFLLENIPNILKKTVKSEL